MKILLFILFFAFGIDISNARNIKELEVPLLKDSTLFYYNNEGRYFINYCKEYKIPIFVSYILTKKEVLKNSVERSNRFEQDSHFQNQLILMAEDDDYKKSGYDRGHMLPSADRNDSEKENQATFIYSNITPQNPALNRRTLYTLERDIRHWASKYDSLYIVTGSIIRDKIERPIKTIGNKVAVPQYIYKVIVVKFKGNYEAIGFILPNIGSISSNFWDYMETVDEIEKISGQDFFHKLPDDIENSIENNVNLDFWEIAFTK